MVLPEVKSREVNSITTTPFLLKRLPADWTPPAPPPAAAWTAPPEGREAEQPPFDWAQETARLAGSVIHAWFERIAEDGLGGWNAARVEGLRAHFSRDLERRGLAPAELKRGADIVAAALRNALADERGRWILGPHPLAQSELRLRTPSGKSMRIDRYIEDAQGARWVIDFKTGEHRGDQDAWLDEQVRRYAAQLETYAQAKEGARRALYFPLLRGWREW